MTMEHAVGAAEALLILTAPLVTGCHTGVQGGGDVATTTETVRSDSVGPQGDSAGRTRATLLETLLHEDLRLHQRIVARDESALMECLDRIGDIVYCIALRRAADAAAAEDLTEALFLELWREPDRFHPERGPVALQLIQRMERKLGPT